MAARAAAAQFYLAQHGVGEAPAAARPGPRRRDPGADDGEGLRRHLLQRYKLGKMTAASLCTIAWHATRAGAKGVDDLASPPDSTNHAEFLRSAINARQAKTFYFAKVPLWDQEKEERCLFPFPMALPHEEFARLYPSSPGDYDVMAVEQWDLPLTYMEHQVYMDKGSLAVPLGYFSDAVPHTNRDSFIAYYWSNTLTGERHLICSLRIHAYDS